MPLRINKMIGYGLVDLAVNDRGDLTDPRINRDSPLLRWDGAVTAWSYLAWLGDQNTRAARIELADVKSVLDRTDGAGQGDARVSPDRACGYNCEYGLPNVLLLRPLWMPDWRRHDNPIDYEEARLDPEPMRCTADPLPGGIHPFTGVYVDVRTGQRLDQTVMHWVRARNGGRADERLLNDLAQLIRYRAEVGEPTEQLYTSHADALQHIAPEVPDPVRLLAEFGALFTDPDGWQQLRPMRYVWWS